MKVVSRLVPITSSLTFTTSIIRDSWWTLFRRQCNKLALLIKGLQTNKIMLRWAHLKIGLLLSYVSKFTIINANPIHYHTVVDIVIREVRSFATYLQSSGRIASKASYSEVQLNNTHGCNSSREHGPRKSRGSCMFHYVQTVDEEGS